MNIYKLVVDFHDNQKDYVGATVYHNDIYQYALDDIAKPDELSDYTIEWKNGLISYYKNILNDKLPFGAVIVTL